MGTTSQKLTYLNDTKTKIRDGINAIGGSLDSDDTFRSYVDELESLYDEMPKVSDTGTNITLDNTRVGKMELTYKGNTQQDSTTGKQLFQDEYILTPSNTINAILTAGTYTIATCDGQTFGQSIYFKLFDSSGNVITSGGHLTASNIQNFSTSSYTYYGGSSSTKATFTIDNDYKLNIGLLSSTGTRQVMLVSGSTEDRTYEPYTNGASPNPDYPQDIHNVSGDNTIEICGKNLCNTYAIGNTTEITINADGSLTMSNVISTNGYQSTGKKLYELCPNLKVGDIVYLYIDTDFYYNGTKRDLIYVGEAWNNGESKTITDTLLNKTVIVYGGYQTTSHLKIAIAKTQLTTYEAYTGASYPINLPVENICSQVSIVDSATIRCDVDNKKLEQTFTISLTPPKTVSQMDIVAFADSTNLHSVGKIDLTLDTKSSATITLTQSIYETIQSASEVHFNIYKNGAGISTTATINDAQIENGSKLNSYTPYGTTPIELNKIGNYQDYIYKTDKWYWHKEIGKVVLNGSEDSWEKSDVSGNVVTQRYAVYLQPHVANIGYSDLLHIKTEAESVFSDTELLQLSGSGSGTYTGIQINKSRLAENTLAAFKTWLSANNTTLYYVLATPTYTEITDTTLLGQLEAIKYSYDNQTNVSQSNNDLPFILDVSSLKEWE